jgi:hypothetical protein
MPNEREWEARKERLQAQIAALRAKQQQLEALRRQAETRRKSEERRLSELERMADTLEQRADEAEEEVDEAEQCLEEAEEEYEESEDDDAEEREMPDLSKAEAKLRKAMEKLNRLNLSGLGESINLAVQQSLAAAGVHAGHPGHAGHPVFDVERMRQELGGRSNTVMTRISDEDLATLDTLVDAGLASSRSECAAMFVHEGMIARRDLISRVKQKAEQIRRLKDSMREELKGLSDTSAGEGKRATGAPPAPPIPPAPPAAPAPPAPRAQSAPQGLRTPGETEGW